jgi:hypothetical protein
MAADHAPPTATETQAADRKHLRIVMESPPGIATDIV